MDKYSEPEEILSEKEEESKIVPSDLNDDLSDTKKGDDAQPTLIKIDKL